MRIIVSYINQSKPPGDAMIRISARVRETNAFENRLLRDET